MTIKLDHINLTVENLTDTIEWYAIREQCGSYGSRLHLAKNGDYIAYAQWPDAKTREACELDSTLSGARALMREAVERSYPDEEFIVKNDLLIFPAVT